MEIRNICCFALLSISSHAVFANEALVEADVPSCDYSKLLVSVPATISLVAKGDASGHVKGDKKELGYLKYECSNGVLRIGSQGGASFNHDLHFDLANGSIKSVRINGNQHIDVTELASQSFKLSINGSGESSLSGTADYLDLIVNGTATINASRLESKIGNVTINGTGEVQLQSSEELKANINGSGRVEYQGSPKHINTKVNGSGDISAVG